MGRNEDRRGCPISTRPGEEQAVAADDLAGKGRVGTGKGLGEKVSEAAKGRHVRRGSWPGGDGSEPDGAREAPCRRLGIHRDRYDLGIRPGPGDRSPDERSPDRDDGYEAEHKAGEGQEDGADHLQASPNRESVQVWTAATRDRSPLPVGTNPITAR
jgi:hypothetical protein